MVNGDLGTVTVSTKAIVQIAEYITICCDGVVKLTNRTKHDKISAAIHNLQQAKGVYVKKTKTGLDIEIAVIARYGANVNTLCNTVSENIKSEIENNMGAKVSNVKVYIEGMEI